MAPCAPTPARMCRYRARRASPQECMCLRAVYKHVFSKLKEKQSVISEES